MPRLIPKHQTWLSAVSGLVGNIASLGVPLTDSPPDPSEKPKPKPLPPGLYALQFGKNGMVNGLLPAIQHEGACS